MVGCPRNRVMYLWPGKDRFFFFSKASRAALWHTGHSFQWIPGSFTGSKVVRARSWLHTPYIRPSEWVELCLHSPYTFMTYMETTLPFAWRCCGVTYILSQFFLYSFCEFQFLLCGVWYPAAPKYPSTHSIRRVWRVTTVVAHVTQNIFSFLIRTLRRILCYRTYWTSDCVGAVQV
jgi:hypothetical protein